jgi:hypothetical protein
MGDAKHRGADALAPDASERGTRDHARSGRGRGGDNGRCRLDRGRLKTSRYPNASPMEWG